MNATRTAFLAGLPTLVAAGAVLMIASPSYAVGDPNREQRTGSTSLTSTERTTNGYGNCGQNRGGSGHGGATATATSPDAVRISRGGPTLRPWDLCPIDDSVAPGIQPTVEPSVEPTVPVTLGDN
jgi:hypothetical protein